MTRIRLAAANAAVALLLLAPAVAVAQADLPPAQDIIDRYVEAIGGRDAVLRARTSRTTGTFALPAAGIEGSLVVLSGSPNRLYTTVEIPGLGLIREGYDGEVGWAVDPNLGPRLLEGRELDALREGAQDEAAVRAASLFQTRETVERAEMNGEACYRIRLVWNSGRETFDCYSLETGLLIGSSGTQESPMGALEAVTLLEDYESFGDVRMPTTVRQQMMGMEQVLTIEAVEFDVVEPDAFTPPDVIRTLITQKTQ